MALGTGFPCGSSTRPTTNIRPGAGRWFVSSDLAATCGRGAAGCGLGSSWLARECVRYPAPVAPATMSNKVVAISLSLFANMARSTSWARDAAKGEAACPAANSIAARVVMSQSAGETKAEADRGLSPTASAAAGKTRPRRVRPSAELVP